MRFSTQFFMLIASCLCLALAQVTYDDCCLKYVTSMKPGIKNHAVSYRFQVTDGGCNIPAVVFTMKRGRVFCADPGREWVIELMKRIDARKTGIKKSTRTPHRARG